MLRQSAEFPDRHSNHFPVNRHLVDSGWASVRATWVGVYINAIIVTLAVLAPFIQLGISNRHEDRKHDDLKADLLTSVTDEYNESRGQYYRWKDQQPAIEHIRASKRLVMLAIETLDADVDKSREIINDRNEIFFEARNYPDLAKFLHDSGDGIRHRGENAQRARAMLRTMNEPTNGDVYLQTYSLGADFADDLYNLRLLVRANTLSNGKPRPGPAIHANCLEAKWTAICKEGLAPLPVYNPHLRTPSWKNGA